MIYSKSKKETSKPGDETKQIIEENCAMLKESKPSTMNWFCHGQKMKNLNRIWEIHSGRLLMQWANQIQY